MLKADSCRGLWERLRASALWAKLRSPGGPVLVALTVALVAVMIYMACNLHSCGASTSGTISSSGGSLWRTSGTTSNDDLSAILSRIEGAGSTDVLVTYDRSGALVGVIVVSEGAGDSGVSVRLMRAVQTATGADLDQIQIFTKDK